MATAAAPPAPPPDDYGTPAEDPGSPARRGLPRVSMSLPGIAEYAEADASPPASARDSPARDRTTGALVHYLILGDPDEYESQLQKQDPEAAASPQRVAALPAESELPDDLREAAQSYPAGRDDILRVYGRLKADRHTMLEALAAVRARRHREEGTMHKLAPMRASLNPERQGAFGQGTNSLSRWEEQLDDWERTQARLARRTGRDPAATVMNRNEFHRPEVELKDALARAEPARNKYSVGVWQMSLRDCHERPVQVGNDYLSGLWCEAGQPKKDREPLQRVGKPRLTTDRMGTTAALFGGASAGLRSTRTLAEELRGTADGEAILGRAALLGSTRRRGWQEGPAFADKARRVFGKLERDLGHEPDMEDLFVEGSSLEDALWERASREVTLFDVAHALRGARPDVAHALLDAAEQQRNAMADISFADQSGHTGAASLASAGRASTAAPRGASVELEGARVLLHAPVGGHQQGCAVLRNTGSTVLYYEWQPVDLFPSELSQARRMGAATAARGRAFTPPMSVLAARDATAQGGPAEAPEFFLVEKGGSLLPGHARAVYVGFKGSRPGMSTAAWELKLKPEPEAGVPGAPDAPLRLVARGVATRSEGSKLEREALERQLAERQMRVAVAMAVDRAVEDAADETRAARPEQDVAGYSLEEHALWQMAYSSSSATVAGGADDPDMPIPAYYWPDKVQAARDAYLACRDLLVKPVEQPKGKAKPDPNADAYAAKLPETWPCSLNLVDEAARLVEEATAALSEKDREASKEARAAAVDAARAAARACREASALPPTRRHMLFNAFWETVCQGVDDVETQAEKLRAEMEAAVRKAQETTRAEEAEAEAEGEGEGEGGEKEKPDAKKDKKDAEDDGKVAIDHERFAAKVAALLKRQLNHALSSMPQRIVDLERGISGAVDAQVRKLVKADTGADDGHDHPSRVELSEGPAWERYQWYARKTSLLDTRFEPFYQDAATVSRAKSALKSSVSRAGSSRAKTGSMSMRRPK
ncbi:unnamed protein product [Pedinophyceae sp. YPF-701]|nr:unnamed protein product [Pedinophyceae sp. YPF-701]